MSSSILLVVCGGHLVGIREALSCYNNAGTINASEVGVKGRREWKA
jgi:hypothetical protein